MWAAQDDTEHSVVVKHTFLDIQEGESPSAEYAGCNGQLRVDQLVVFSLLCSYSDELSDVSLARISGISPCPKPSSSKGLDEQCRRMRRAYSVSWMIKA